MPRLRRIHLRIDHRRLDGLLPVRTEEKTISRESTVHNSGLPVRSPIVWPGWPPSTLLLGGISDVDLLGYGLPAEWLEMYGSWRTMIHCMHAGIFTAWAGPVYPLFSSGNP